MQYLRQKKKVKNSYKVAGATNLSILAYCLTYCLLCLNTSIVFKDFKEAIYMAFDVPEYKLAINLILFWLMFLQIPFKFFLEKEFLFILYDELKDLGVSESVDGIQRDLYAERGYNQSAIERVSTRDHY